MKYYWFPIHREKSKALSHLERRFPRVKDYVMAQRGEYLRAQEDYWGPIVNEEDKNIMCREWPTNYDITESIEKEKREKERKEKELAPLSLPSRRIRI